MSDDTLMEFFNHDAPLGRTQAISGTTDRDKELFQAYFDSNNYPMRQMAKNPTMIVGRRGSGKTDALLSYSLQHSSRKVNHKPVIYFEARHSANLFNSLVSLISTQVEEKLPKPMVEAVTVLWEAIFWFNVVVELDRSLSASDDPDCEYISKFLSSFDLNSNESNPFTAALAFVFKLIESYSSNSGSQFLNFFNVLPSILENEFDIENVKYAAMNVLRKNNSQAIILFDSFEELDASEIDNNLVLSAFLKCVGEFQMRANRVDVRCCVPAEIYHYMLSISSNIVKDFQKTNILHWTSAELMKISALRYREFLKLHFPGEPADFALSFDMENRTQVLRFWGSVLPAMVPNTKLDLKEHCIPYILRHTQLLPRQVLTLLNDILAENLRQSGDPMKVDSEIVSTRITQKEGFLAQQIIESYSKVWPKADSQVPAFLGRLKSNIITYGDMHTAARQADVYHEGNVEDRHDLYRLLSELGVIGRLIERTEKYAKAVFEYVEPNRLSLNENDEVCIHPLFTEAFGVIKDGNTPDNYLPVYPYGADFEEGPDRRKNLME